MAKLRIRADLIFDDEDPQAAKTLAQLQALAGKLRKIEPATERGITARVERSSIELHRCTHDEEAGDPCEVLDSWEKS